MMARIVLYKGRAIALLVTTLLLGIAVRTAAAQSNQYVQHHSPSGRDAFNRVQVDTTQDFVTLLRNNAALRQRYARHFGVSQEKVIDFVRYALVPYRLPKSQTLTTFGVTRSGRIYPVTDRLKKGTKVWATREGVPVLKWTCSNPLVYELPGKKLGPPESVAYSPTRMPPKMGPLPMSPLDMVPDQLPLSVSLLPKEPDFPIDLSVVGRTSVVSEMLPTTGMLTPGKIPIFTWWPGAVIPLVGEIIDENKPTPQPQSSEAPPYAPGIVPEAGSAELLLIGVPLAAGAMAILGRRYKV